MPCACPRGCARAHAEAGHSVGGHAMYMPYTCHEHGMRKCVCQLARAATRCAPCARASPCAPRHPCRCGYAHAHGHAHAHAHAYRVAIVDEDLQIAIRHPSLVLWQLRPVVELVRDVAAVAPLALGDGPRADVDGLLDGGRVEVGSGRLVDAPAGSMRSPMARGTRHGSR